MGLVYLSEKYIFLRNFAQPPHYDDCLYIEFMEWLPLALLLFSISGQLGCCLCNHVTACLFLRLLFASVFTFCVCFLPAVLFCTSLFNGGCVSAEAPVESFDTSLTAADASDSCSDQEMQALFYIVVCPQVHSECMLAGWCNMGQIHQSLQQLLNTDWSFIIDHRRLTNRTDRLTH